MKITRRSFLKALGLTTGAAATGVSIKTEASKAAAPFVAAKTSGITETGLIREICVYEINRDTFIARWDILIDRRFPNASAEQFHVAMEYGAIWGEQAQVVKGSMLYVSKGDPVRQPLDMWLEDHRPLAKQILSDHLRTVGATWKDVVQMELPVGVQRARYL